MASVLRICARATAPAIRSCDSFRRRRVAALRSVRETVGPPACGRVVPALHQGVKPFVVGGDKTAFAAGLDLVIVEAEAAQRAKASQPLGPGTSRLRPEPRLRQSATPCGRATYKRASICGRRSAHVDRHNGFCSRGDGLFHGRRIEAKRFVNLDDHGNGIGKRRRSRPRRKTYRPARSLRRRHRSRGPDRRRK